MDESQKPGLELVVPARPEFLRPIRSIVTQFAQALGAGPAARHAVGTAVNEATTNSVVHAYAGGKGSVTLSAKGDDDVLVVTVTDEGRGHDVPARGTAETGRGLPLIRALASRVEYDRGRRGSRIRMTFRLRRDPAG
jgi:anti-sigma regulatory factor (Ser/Thr protein kinase)